ncbi:LytTR family DNA-binding domain-containing protein [uncultured Paraglaciecola sp.]|uniref:LytTR family DNA-binding domain-containing protein n=1 Tax=uncultured Paraglaciecola sp. TaxID=1765024 RepID=UPI0030D8D0C4|tara:strand:+ start:53594 stop:54478 length:885 start_codon:yes stop_codon:yes gene_type:complete
MQFTKEYFQTHKFAFEMLALFCYLGINATINATTELMEDAREVSASFQSWEPFVWEFSSALATLIIFPAIAWFMRKYPWDWQTKKRSAGRFIVAAISYAVIHICLMVAMRELVYLFTESDYQFSSGLGQFLFEFLYELRKDLWSFAFFVALIAIYRYMISQWLGDAQSISNHSVSENDSQKSKSLANILLVKKLGKEFLIKTSNIEWVEACGNYVNLHIGDQIYPMRITLSEFMVKSRRYGLVRVHKSFAVNINWVHFIEPLVSGDGEIVMQSGEKIRLSRRYKVDFETLVTHH